MAQLSNKIKEYCKANGVSDVDFLKMLSCKTTVMVKVRISKNGT
jgi:hypothetical protein